ncbi:hypothetical protein IFM89_020789 [Coptis chinensis]|uniref:Uncharacterized protein n=1 Tax=Coptis chinensis TaxID=261450 RepID=A0A835HTY5_9MAGN|nr:hypothetical protein IFM89_020789 [Coptis chinensis]
MLRIWPLPLFRFLVMRKQVSKSSISLERNMSRLMG